MRNPSVLAALCVLAPLVLATNPASAKTFQFTGVIDSVSPLLESQFSVGDPYETTIVIDPGVASEWANLNTAVRFRDNVRSFSVQIGSATYRSGDQIDRSHTLLANDWDGLDGIQFGIGDGEGPGVEGRLVRFSLTQRFLDESGVAISSLSIPETINPTDFGDTTLSIRSYTDEGDLLLLTGRTLMAVPEPASTAVLASLLLLLPPRRRA